MTSSNRFEKKTVFQTLILALGLALFANPTWAQDDQDEDTTESEEAVDEDEAADLGRIVVTGSRLQRETYTSIQPLQIITSEGSREAKYRLSTSPQFRKLLFSVPNSYSTAVPPSMVPTRSPVWPTSSHGVPWMALK
jgi:hypothetical protein